MLARKVALSANFTVTAPDAAARATPVPTTAASTSRNGPTFRWRLFRPAWAASRFRRVSPASTSDSVDRLPWLTQNSSPGASCRSVERHIHADALASAPRVESGLVRRGAGWFKLVLGTFIKEVAPCGYG